MVGMSGRVWDVNGRGRANVHKCKKEQLNLTANLSFSVSSVLAREIEVADWLEGTSLARNSSWWSY